MEDNLIKFIKLNKWSLIPEKPEIETPNLKKFDDLRYVYNQRIKGVCRPYVLAQKIGWEIKSSIDVQIEPVDEFQLDCSEDELPRLGEELGVNYWIKRGDIFLGIKPDGWFRMHQAKMNGYWNNLFVPNGEKTFEWRLGWGLECPEEYVAMIIPSEKQNKIKVHPGILESKTLDRFNESGTGISIAMEPIEKTVIKRNEVIAKLIIIPKSVLKQKSIVEERLENE